MRQGDAVGRGTDAPIGTLTRSSAVWPRSGGTPSRHTWPRPRLELPRRENEPEALRRASREVVGALLLTSPAYVGPFFPELVKVFVPVVCAWVFIVRRAGLRIDAVTVFGGGTAVAALISSQLGWNPDLSVRYGAFTAGAILYILAVRSYCDSRVRVHWVLVSMWAAGLLQAALLVTVGRHLQQTATASVDRTALGMVNPNVSGWVLAVGIWAGVFVLLSPRSVLPSDRRGRSVVALGTIPMLYALVAGQSRTSFISMAAACGVLLLRRSPRTVYLLGVCAYAVSALVSLFPGLLIGVALAVSRLPVVAQLAANRGGVDGISNRQELWQLAHELANELPWHGAGPGTPVSVSGWELSTHNFVLEAWIGMGWLGLALYLAFLTSIVQSSQSGVGDAVEQRRLAGSGLLLLMPTFLGNTQYWTMTTCVLLGLMSVVYPRLPQDSVPRWPGRRVSLWPRADAPPPALLVSRDISSRLEATDCHG